MSSKNRKKKSDPLDRYNTPTWLIQAILKEILPDNIGSAKRPFRILDPCAGDARFSNEICNYLGDESWVRVDSYDIDPRHPVVEKANFLQLEPNPVYDLIISNPPFTWALEFIQHSMKFRSNENVPIVFILRLNWLGGQWRAKAIRENLPKSIMVTPKRPIFNGSRSDSAEYAAFVWGGHYPALVMLHTEDKKHGLYQYDHKMYNIHKPFPELEEIEINEEEL